MPKSSPLHYISSDGYDIYVGKNNYQNDPVRKMYMTGNLGIGWYEESIPTLINSSVEDAISH